VLVGAAGAASAFFEAAAAGFAGALLVRRLPQTSQRARRRSGFWNEQNSQTKPFAAPDIAVVGLPGGSARGARARAECGRLRGGGLRSVAAASPVALGARLRSVLPRCLRVAATSAGGACLRGAQVRGNVPLVGRRRSGRAIRSALWLQWAI